MPADEFYTLGRIAIEEVDSSSFENMPLPVPEVEETPLLEGVQGTIDGSPAIRKKNSLSIYDLYVLLTQGLQKKVDNLGSAMKLFRSNTGITLKKQLKTDNFRLKVLSFTAEVVRQFLSSALNEDILHIPQPGTLNGHGGKSDSGAHPTGMAWDHGHGEPKGTKPTFFYKSTGKIVPATYVIAATAVCMDQGLLLKGRLGFYETKSGGNPRKYYIKQMHYDYTIWRKEKGNDSKFTSLTGEQDVLKKDNCGWIWHFPRNTYQTNMVATKPEWKGKFRFYFKGQQQKKDILLQAQERASENTAIGDILKLYDQWSGVATKTNIVTFDEYMGYLEEKGNRWKFLAKL